MPPTEILNARIRPRIVVDIQDETLLEKLDVLFGLSGTVIGARSLLTIDWNEWDAVVTDSPPLRPRRELFARRFPDQLAVFYIAHEVRSSVRVVDQGISDAWGGVYLATSAVAGSELSLDASLFSAEYADLVRTGLSVDVQTRDQQWGFSFSSPSPTATQPTVVPLLSGSNGLIIGAHYDRGNGITNWILPSDTDVRPWIQLALERWADELPEAFPSDPAWHGLTQWLSRDERTAEEGIHRADAAFDEAQRRHSEAISMRSLERSKAKAAADSGPRRLLMEAGQPLVEAVIDAFRTIGFEVEDMDQQHAEGSRREDLQLRDESEPGWIAITEVTGVKRGVSQMKWQKLLTHLNIYLRRDDASRIAVAWLVVNQEVGQAPEARSELWQADFRELVAEAGGLAIEAPALYRLLQRIDDATLRPTEARRALREAVGVFTLSDADALESNG